MVMQRLNTGTTGKAFKLILLGVLFAAVAGLVLTDAGGFFRGGVGRQDVARVGRKSIGLVSFAHDYQTALRQSGLTEEQARQMGAPFMVLQQVVSREVLLQAARKTGVRVSDAYVGSELKKQLDTLPQPGTAQEKLNMLLQSRGMTEKMLVDLVRGDYAINVLTASPVSGQVTAPAALLTALYNADKEKRIAQIVTITPNDLKDLKAPNDGEVKAFYDENKDRYKTEETRDVAFLVLPKTLLSNDVDVTSDEVRAYYDEHKNEFMNPERVRFEQVIVDSEKDANAVAEKAGSSLKEAKGEKGQYVDSDWYTKTTLPTELQKAIFTEKKTGLIGPVQSALGWHVMKIDTYQEAQPKEFSEVKDTIARQLKDEKLDSQISDFSDHLDELVSSGEGLKDIAEEYKLKADTLSGLTAINVADKIKSASLPDTLAARVKDSAFTLEEEEVSPLIDMPNGDYALLQVTKVNPAKIPALETIKDRVTADAKKANEEKALISYAEKIIGQYDTRKPDSFYTAVQKNGLKAQDTDALTQAEAEKSFDRNSAALLFSLTPGNRLSFTNAPQKVTLIYLKDILPSKDKPSDTELADLKKKTAAMLSDEIQQQFVQAWQNDIGVALNADLVKRQFVDAQ